MRRCPSCPYWSRGTSRRFVVDQLLPFLISGSITPASEFRMAGTCWHGVEVEEGGARRMGNSQPVDTIQNSYVCTIGCPPSLQPNLPRLNKWQHRKCAECHLEQTTGTVVGFVVFFSKP